MIPREAGMRRLAAVLGLCVMSVAVGRAQAPPAPVVSPEVRRDRSDPALPRAERQGDHRLRRARWPAASDDQGTGRRLERDDRAAPARHLHLRVHRRRRHRARPAERQHQAGLRELRRGERGAGPGRRSAVLRREAGAARRSPDPAVRVQKPGRGADDVGLHAAGLRQGQGLSGAVSAARRRRRRVRAGC